jgi:hypothetical protein
MLHCYYDAAAAAVTVTTILSLLLPLPLLPLLLPPPSPYLPAPTNLIALLNTAYLLTTHVIAKSHLSCHHGGNA